MLQGNVKLPRRSIQSGSSKGQIRWARIKHCIALAQTRLEEAYQEEHRCRPPEGILQESLGALELLLTAFYHLTKIPVGRKDLVQRCISQLIDKLQLSEEHCADRHPVSCYTVLSDNTQCWLCTELVTLYAIFSAASDTDRGIRLADRVDDNPDKPGEDVKAGKARIPAEACRPLGKSIARAYREHVKGLKSHSFARGWSS